MGSAQKGDWRDNNPDQSSSSGTVLTGGDRTGPTETTNGSIMSGLSVTTNESGVEKSVVPNSESTGKN